MGHTRSNSTTETLGGPQVPSMAAAVSSGATSGEVASQANLYLSDSRNYFPRRSITTSPVQASTGSISLSNFTSSSLSYSLFSSTTHSESTGTSTSSSPSSPSSSFLMSKSDSASFLPVLY
ncbi:hypothetical protein M405DRAFT_809316 [Rhizopogon salebrosus TDB-379]|nr:hypothetical protein M405DRAFT_809316 [Rhizopogon salebrosus TDB-379]